MKLTICLAESDIGTKCIKPKGHKDEHFDGVWKRWE